MYEGPVQDLIDELGRLPGVGPKGAQRIAFHLLAADPIDVRRLVAALTEVKDKVRFCVVCGNVAEEEQCRICRDPRRDVSVICVVEEPKDVVAIERTREFRGRYHVLGGAISPESLEVELRWIDDHVDGKPYGVDLLVPTTQLGAPDETIAQLAKAIPDQHRTFVAALLERHGVPLPEQTEAPDLPPATSPA